MDGVEGILSLRHSNKQLLFMVSLLTLGQTWLLTKLLWPGAENEIETSAQICQSDMTNLIELIKLKKKLL